MLINEGKKEILENYLNTYDLWLGLWTSTGKIRENNFTLSSFNFYELKNLKEYKRIVIPKGTWVLGDDLIYTASDITFSPIYQDWTDIYGYFISSSYDNSGILLSITQYDSSQILTKGIAVLTIQPKIKMV